MAHLIACAARAIGFAARALVLIDPVPALSDFPEKIRRSQPSIRDSATDFLSLQLATLARMTERDDKITTMRDDIQREVESWREDELVVRVAERLEQEGLREFTADAVVRVGRQLEAYAEHQWLLAENQWLLAQASAPLPTAQWDTFLVLASDREQFYEKQKDLGIGIAAAGNAGARAYGSIKLEMVLDGKHLAVCQRCAQGEDEAFVQAMQEFRRLSDLKRSSRWRLRTLAATPVLIFEANSAHAQGQATRIMLNGPPAIEQPLCTSVLFVLSNERSGSSLLQLCLQCHSTLYAGQELYLLPFSTLLERGNLLPFEIKEGLQKHLMELRPCTFEGACHWLDHLEKQHTTAWQMYEILQELCGSRILVDKTPHNGDHVSFLQHADAIFGRAARYCHLVRHPYACISSGLELRRDILMNGAVTWAEVEHAYVRLQTNVAAFVSLAHANQSLQITYEALVRKPASTLAKVCHAVGLAYEHGMDAPYESETAVASFVAGSLGAVGDPKL